jgi:hypothetical protein
VGETVGLLQFSVSTHPEVQHAGQYTLKNAPPHPGICAFTKVNNIVGKQNPVRRVSMPESVMKEDSAFNGDQFI